MTTSTRTARRGRRPRKAAPVRRARRAAVTRVTEVGDAAVEQGRALWLAGLGLAGTAVETAVDAFDLLVARGRREEPRTRAAAHRVVRRVRTHAGDLAADATRRSKRKLDQVLDALGVDSSPRPKNLFHRLGDLTEALL